MDLKTLMFLKAASGGSAPAPVVTFDYDYKLTAYTNGLGSNAARRIALETAPNAAYAGCFGTETADRRIQNRTGDGNNRYPIMLNGATKLHFAAPDYVKITVFFVNTQAASTDGWAAWVGGDANAYTDEVPNGPRDVNVPEGADAFSFSVFYKSHEVTDEIMNTVVVTAA